MKASHVNKLLRAAGVHTQSVVEGTEELDGLVNITDLVHVQVATHYDIISVVLQVEGDDGDVAFHFGPIRDPKKPADVLALVQDIRKALGFIGVAA